MSVHAYYLRDLGYLIREEAQQATKRARTSRGNAFAQGEAQALYGVVSLMQQQAEAFGIPLADLALDDLDPDRDLL